MYKRLQLIGLGSAPDLAEGGAGTPLRRIPAISPKILVSLAKSDF